VRITSPRVENFDQRLRALSFALLLIAFPAHASPVVRFTPIAKLDGFRLADDRGGWSPRAPLLLLDGYYVWDASRPKQAPVRLSVHGGARFSSWSPVGDRILFVTGQENRWNWRTLVVTAANDVVSDTLLKDVECWPVAWGPDASIHYRSKGRLLRIEPLASWSVPPAIASAKTATLLHRLDVPGRVITSRIASDGTEEDLDVLNPRLRGPMMSLVDEVLETDRHLIRISGRDGGDYIVDSDGAIQRVVRYFANSMSRDGELVAGGEGIVGGDDTGPQGLDTLRMACPRGNWCVPVRGAEDGAEPQLARTDSLMAFNALHGGVIIGRYQIRSR